MSPKSLGIIELLFSSKVIFELKNSKKSSILNKEKGEKGSYFKIKTIIYKLNQTPNRMMKDIFTQRETRDKRGIELG